MPENFGILPDGRSAQIYTISCGSVTAQITNYGAALVRLLVPDKNGTLADVVLGCDDVTGYAEGFSYLGATIGRNANRIKNGCFVLEGKTWSLPTFMGHSLHSGPDCFHRRLWEVESQEENRIAFYLFSPHGDQGFPGNAHVRVTYTLEYPASLTISYDASCDRMTVFNMTNHSYFNLAGHDRPELAMDQTLMLPARHYTHCNHANIPTGKLRKVDGTPLDFRVPKPLGQDIRGFFRGYDHNFEVFCAPCAVLCDPHSGRTMSVTTDCPGIQIYTPGGIRTIGKGGIRYGKYPAVCLETQFWPDAVNHPEWAQPFTKDYHSQTTFQFSW
ncbi:MAG: galactose mutarotase [Ruminococcaceae bacterium]|nr:galactose mutarotase [Oscillospiraceae bacterium]